MASETVGVVVATFNGAKYLRAQLKSIVEQDRPPDQVVVTDDGSEDGSVEIAREAAAPLGRRLIVLTGRAGGPTPNFERGLATVTTDLIALADQDDVWRSDKLGTLAEAFSRRRDIDGVFTDGRVVDAEGVPMDKTLWGSVGFSLREQRRWQRRPLDVLMRRDVVTGATLALRRRSLKRVLPLPRPGWHDRSIAILLASRAALLPLPKRLIDYRVHESNLAGLPTSTYRSRLLERSCHREAMASLAEQLRVIQARLTLPEESDAVERIDEKLRFLGWRTELPEERLTRAVPILRQMFAGQYRRNANGLWSAARDAIY